MNKKLLKTYQGIIVDKFLPDVLQENEFLYEENINYIGLKIKIGDEEIKIIEDRNSAYSDLFVEDKVIVNKYGYLYEYEEYLKEIKKEISKLCSAHNEETKKKVYEQFFVSKQEFILNPKMIVRYEVCFDKINGK